MLWSIQANAVTINVAGAIADDAGNEVTEWYTTTTLKTLDADGDNRYGSDGWDMFGLNVNHTSYNAFAGIGPGIIIVGPFPGYAVVDNPGNPDAQVRTSTNGIGGPGSKEAVISYQITDATQVPNGIRIGIFTDGLDGSQFSSQEIYVEQTAGVGPFGAAQFDTNPILNNTIDMVFFDLTNLQTGDVYTISVDSGRQGHATLQGVVWDSLSAPIPEPAMLGVFGVGALALVTRRRH